MPGLFFNDTTNKQGLLQEDEFLLNMPTGTISGTTQNLNDFTRKTNIWLQRLVSIIMLAQDDWEWDDPNNQYYPVATRSMNANQQDYKFTSALWSLLNTEAAAFTFAQNPTISNASPAVITLTGHGLSVNDVVQFTTTGSLPTGISASTNYYVISAGLTANAFEISATLGGTAINTSSAGSGTHTLTRSLNPFRVQRVELSFDSGTTWYKAAGLTINQIGQPTDFTDIQANFPLGATQTGQGQANFSIVTPFVEFRNNALWLYPVPTSASTNGIKVWFDRGAIEFLTTDTVKQPPIDADFHEILALGPSYDYAFIKNLPQAPAIKGRLDEKMAEFKLRYGSKDQNIQWVLGSIYDDTYGS